MENAGTLELIKASEAQVKAYANSRNMRPHHGFWDRLDRARNLALLGHAARKSMPVIEHSDFEKLKALEPPRSVECLRMSPDHLVPLQYQIYVDKCIDWIAQNPGRFHRLKLMGENPLLISADHRIIDGHHRWLSAMLVGLPVRTYRFNLNAENLLALSLMMSDTEHHLRNR